MKENEILYFNQKSSPIEYRGRLTFKDKRYRAGMR